ncbi:hypothetical protein [Silvimonas sp.]|uniref:hypothetical protein n=1 Tax=Silvimonas sp. TaxID=2650811 RepID=UPI00283CF82D|nr:hypothetical protein [Silvimonas sp.]MDR3429988.1 hypothetical protein [Silvimonas sp.]
MNAAQLIDYATSTGLLLSVKGDVLKLSGNRVAANDAFIRDLRQHKAEVIDILVHQPVRAVLPYALHGGGGGQIIDPDGLLSAVTELHQRYGKRLDLEHLAAWFEQRVTLVWPVSDRWQVEQERKALAALKSMEKRQ